MLKRLCHAPSPSEPASLAGTATDVLAGLAIVAFTVAAVVWLQVLS